MRKIKNPTEKIIFLSGVVLLFAIMRIFDLPCVIKAIFKIPCFGCGMSRAVISLFKLELVNAFKFHPMVWSLPLLVVYFLKDGKVFGKWADRCVLSLIFCGFVVAWVLKLTGVLPA